VCGLCFLGMSKNISEVVVQSGLCQAIMFVSFLYVEDGCNFPYLTHISLLPCFPSPDGLWYLCSSSPCLLLGL